MAKGFHSPPGTRDFYPIELARRRFIEDAWRKVSIRHGFEEIDGPTFETIELYKAKSGDAIVSEIFQVFSGKGQGGGKGQENPPAGAGGSSSPLLFEAPFALRPEFTPTLARMYAARAAQLPKPAKWFWQQNCFRAERQQRGRLKEFMQWNVDHIGGDSRLDADVDILLCAADLFAALGLAPEQLSIRVGDRDIAAALLTGSGVAESGVPAGLALLDKRAKLPADVATRLAAEIGLDLARFDSLAADATAGRQSGEAFDAFEQRRRLWTSAGIGAWMTTDFSIARGLAYYTGMVFEVHEASGAERAVAGGGRYDNLIETFGGPPTPAVGFGMGDVVLSLVLQDKGLMPSDRDIARALGLRPDVFVISNGNPESDAAVAPLLARLRRRGMHARRSYKATKNIGKLLKEAADADARYGLIIEGGDPLQATLKTLDDGGQDKGDLETMLARITPA